MLETLKREVCDANLKLVEYGLVILTWGNVSALSEDGKFVVIKPSGVDYSSMCPEQMVVTDLSGTVVEGEVIPTLIDELPMAVECRLVSYDPDSCCLVGEIVNVSADESVLGVDGKIDPEKLRPITFDPIHNAYRVLGEKVGNAFRDGAKLK